MYFELPFQVNQVMTYLAFGSARRMADQAPAQPVVDDASLALATPRPQRGTWGPRRGRGRARQMFLERRQDALLLSTFRLTLLSLNRNANRGFRGRGQVVLRLLTILRRLKFIRI